MEIVKIKASLCDANTGQIDGLPANPRQWTSAEVDALATSIKETPELFEARPLLVYAVGERYVVLGGNLRLCASKRLKMRDVPAIVFPDDTPVDKLREIVIKDNGAFGNWDYDLLANEWDDLPLTDWGVPAWESLTDDGKEEEVKEVTEDNFSEADEVEQRCARGDVWRLGEHRLMCGDSTSVDDVARLMDGGKAEMMFTDPPYGMKYQSAKRIDSERFAVLKNDDKILDFMPTARSFVEGFVFVCTTWKVLDRWLPLFMQSYDLTNMIIWDKGGGGIGDLKKTFWSDYEIIMVSHNGHQIVNGRIGSVWSVGKDDVNTYVHPTQKPIGLPAMAIEHTTNKGGIVLDLFGGSGSTMMACEQTGRKCFTMELDPHYCDVIIARWEKMTGKEAKKI